MHKDTQEALERLERELLAEEKPELTDDDLDLLIDDILFDDEEEEELEPPRNHANHYRAYNADPADLDLDGYSDEVYEEPTGSKGELIFSMVMLGLITLVMILWAVSLL